MLPPSLIHSADTEKELDRAGEDLEDAAARHGLKVVSIHDLAPGMSGCRLYEICHEASAREVLTREPAAAVLVPLRVLLTRSAGRTRLVALRPEALLAGVGGLDDLAGDLGEILFRVVTEAAR